MRASFGLSVLLAILLVLGYGAAGQEKRVMRFEGDNFFLMHELMLVLSETEGRVVVQMDPPEQVLKGEKADIDIKAGDAILMMNGKRVKNTAAMRDLYEKLEVGDEIKLGVKRGEEMFIVSFEKAEQQDASGQVIIRREITDDGGGGGKEKKEL